VSARREHECALTLRLCTGKAQRESFAPPKGHAGNARGHDAGREPVEGDSVNPVFALRLRDRLRELLSDRVETAGRRGDAGTSPRARATPG